MEDENFLVGGKQLHELRVVDLKKECDRNKLPKNGTKRELIERLKAVGIWLAHIEINSDTVGWRIFKTKRLFPFAEERFIMTELMAPLKLFDIVIQNINIAVIVNTVLK